MQKGGSTSGERLLRFADTNGEQVAALEVNGNTSLWSGPGEHFASLVQREELCHALAKGDQFTAHVAKGALCSGRAEKSTSPRS